MTFELSMHRFDCREIPTESKDLFSGQGGRTYANRATCHS